MVSMIVGIDDSGNFNTDSLSFYAAIFIRPKRYLKIKKIFLEWEAQLPDNVKVNGEVKGSLLNENQIIEFANKILINNGYGAIKAQAFAIEINNEHNMALRNQQALNVAQMRQQAKEIYRDQGKEYIQIASFYEQMSAWLESKSLKTLYKIELLGISIVKSFNLSIITSTLRGFDRELESLEINIDEGITGRPSVEQYWKDTMRTIFWHITSSVEPIIHITEWRPNHPFVKKFYKYPRSRDFMGVFTQKIRDVFQFYDSKDRYEIRIADIVANAYFRKYVKNESIEEAYKLISSQRIRFDSPYVNVKLGDRQNPNPVNPYTDKFRGVTAAELGEKYGPDN